MKKIILAVLAAFALIAVPSAAFAGGSDSPTPYTVTTEGVTLPDGQVFQDGGHVNIRTTANISYNLHFEDRNWPVDHPKRAYIGKSFLPWSAFGIPEGQTCIQWVQVHGFNEHYGEGGQPVVGPDCAAGPEDPDEDKHEPTEDVGESSEDNGEDVGEESSENPTEPGEDAGETSEEATEGAENSDETGEDAENPTEPGEDADEEGNPLDPAGGNMTPLLYGGAAVLLLGGTFLIGRATRKTES